MKHYPLLFILLVITTISGCQFRKSADTVESVKVEFPSNSDDFFDIVQQITLIPLETAIDFLIAGSPNLEIYNDDFFIIDNRVTHTIYRYSKDGRFLNRIGAKGRGPEEYNAIGSVAIEDDIVYIYSHPDISEYKYNIDGIFISNHIYDFSGGWTAITPINEGYLIYRGFGMGDNVPRFEVRDKTFQKTGSFLNTSAKVINFTEEVSPFSKNGDFIHTRETYMDTIYTFTPDHIMTLRYVFDMGKYSIPIDFFNFSDAFQAMEHLMKRPFAVIYRYLESDKYAFIEILVQGKEIPDFIYGIYRKESGEWKWANFGDPNDYPFSASIRLLKGEKLYCLLDPVKLKNLTKRERSSIVNADLLNSVNENDNFIIAEIKLK